MKKMNKLRKAAVDARTARPCSGLPSKANWNGWSIKD